MTKILITGGCGFIGSNLIKYLLNKTNWYINILDNLSSGYLKDVQKLIDLEKRITFFKGDIVNKEDISLAIKDCDYLVNLAAQTNVLASIKDPFYDESVNVRGILNLLDGSVNNNIKKFIHASSAAAVGDQEMPMNELKVPMPISPYGASKLAGEAYCSVFSKSYGLLCIALRFSNVYGPNSYNKGSVIAKFIKKIIRKESLEIFGDGNQTRDFIHVMDICSGIHLALIKEIKNYEIFQLGTGIETTINDLVHFLILLAKKYNLKEPEIKYEKPIVGEIIKNYCDISKAKDKLGFSIKYDLYEGLKGTFEWFIKNFN